MVLIIRKPSPKEADEYFTRFYNLIDEVCYTQNHRFKRHTNQDEHYLEVVGYLNLICGIQALPLIFQYTSQGIRVLTEDRREASLYLPAIHKSFKGLWRHKNRLTWIL